MLLIGKPSISMGHGFHSYVNVYRGCMYIYIYSMIHWRTYCGRVCSQKKLHGWCTFSKYNLWWGRFDCPQINGWWKPLSTNTWQLPEKLRISVRIGTGVRHTQLFVDHKWIILKLENCNQLDSHPRWGFEHAWHGGATNEIWWPER